MMSSALGRQKLCSGRPCLTGKFVLTHSGADVAVEAKVETNLRCHIKLSVRHQAFPVQNSRAEVKTDPEEPEFLYARKERNGMPGPAQHPMDLGSLLG